MLADPPAVVLAYHDGPGDDGALVLARVDATGQLGWTTHHDHDDVIGAHLVGDRIVIALRYSLIALDARTGAVAYEHAF